MNEEQRHRVEAYRDLRIRLIDTRCRERWQMEQTQSRRQVLKRVARLEMLSEIINLVGELAGL